MCRVGGRSTVEPRARWPVWPGRRCVPGIVAPRLLGSTRSRMSPSRRPLSHASCDGPTARQGLCHRNGSGTTEARPPPERCPRLGTGRGFVAPHGQSRGGFSEKQWSVKRKGRAGGARKAPNEANRNRPLITCPQAVKVDGFGPSYAERSQFRVVEAGTSRGWPCWKLARGEEGC